MNYEEFTEHVKQGVEVYVRDRLKDGFVVIRDSDTVYWIRSLKDPNVWMKLEED